MPNRTQRIVAGLALTIGVTLATGSGIAIRQSAHATSTNPWTYTMTDPSKNGMTVNGVSKSLAQIFTVKDSHGAPIFSIGHVGGPSVFGDHLRIFPPGNTTNPVVDIGPDGRISITGPNAGIWVNGQLLTASDIAWIHEHD